MYANRLTISFANIHKIVIGCSRKRYYLSFINKIHIIMTGKDLKNKLETTNYSISEIAKGIGMSQPALFNKFRMTLSALHFLRELLSSCKSLLTGSIRVRNLLIKNKTTNQEVSSHIIKR